MNQWNNDRPPHGGTAPLGHAPVQAYPQQQQTYPQQQGYLQQQPYPQQSAAPQQVWPQQQAWPQQQPQQPYAVAPPAAQQQSANPQNPYGVTPEQREELHILAAILNGTGVPNPRKLGVGALVTSAIAIGVNLVFILAFERYYLWLAVIPAPLLLCGAFMAITNQPRVAQGVRPPQWVRFALAILAIIGLFGSFTFVRFLSGR